METSRPTTSALYRLHEKLAEALISKLDDPECPASVYKEAISFLKENNIEATEANTALRSLASATVLPFSGDTADTAEA